MNASVHRRRFLKQATGLACVSGTAAVLPAAARAQGEAARNAGAGVSIALNAYSFNAPLRAGTMTLEDVVDFCAQHGIRALDATGYYFPGYPSVPSLEYAHRLKKRAFLNGVTIHGTGVRNDFAVEDAAARKKDVQLVKDWIETARELGSSVIRVFSGAKAPEGRAFGQVLEWMIPDLKECAAHGARHGVMVGLQNHNDFVRTADEAIRIAKAVNSDWFGIILDVGSLRRSDPYKEIEKLLPYAVSWQLKEQVWYGDKAVPTDLQRIKAMIARAGYRGFLPIETLGEGDPREKVPAFLEKVRGVFGA